MGTATTITKPTTTATQPAEVHWASLWLTVLVIELITLPHREIHEFMRAISMELFLFLYGYFFVGSPPELSAAVSSWTFAHSSQPINI